MKRFLALKQGSMTVKEYVNKLNQLARFGLELVDAPHNKALQFVIGLNEPLRGLAISHIPMWSTFENLVDMALMYEEDKGEKKETKTEGTSQNRKVWPKKGQQQQQQKKGGKDDKGKDKRKCHNCGKEGHLIKDCKRRKANCFNCGEVGHFSKESPKK